MITCTVCKVAKDDGDFYARERRCKPCMRAKNRKWYAENRELVRERGMLLRATNAEYRAKANARAKKWVEDAKVDGAKYAAYRLNIEDSYLKRRYGRGRPELQQMLRDQGDACALCRKPLSWEKRHVDHIDTSSGPVVRGILCSSCNTSLGKFGDDPTLMRRAADYVEMGGAYALGPIRSPNGKAAA
jgi:hypothetical protein